MEVNEKIEKAARIHAKSLDLSDMGIRYIPEELFETDALRVLLCGTSSPLPHPDRARPCTAVFAAGRFWVRASVLVFPLGACILLPHRVGNPFDVLYQVRPDGTVPAGYLPGFRLLAGLVVLSLVVNLPRIARGLTEVVRAARANTR